MMSTKHMSGARLIALRSAVVQAREHLAATEKALSSAVEDAVSRKHGVGTGTRARLLSSGETATVSRIVTGDLAIYDMTRPPCVVVRTDDHALLNMWLGSEYEVIE